MHTGQRRGVVTAQVGAGANIVLFTTGLGTPTGNPIAPVEFHESNLRKKMPDIIDIDTGGVISGSKPSNKWARDFGPRNSLRQRRKQDEGGVAAQNDFIPWKRGVSSESQARTKGVISFGRQSCRRHRGGSDRRAIVQRFARSGLACESWTSTKNKQKWLPSDVCAAKFM